MGKKSKSKGGPSKNRAQDAAPAQAFNKKASRVKRIETAEDAMGGDEDAFHSNRDSVLFEDNGTGSDNGMDVSDDDEIFGLNLPESESESEPAADDDDELDDDEEDEPSYPTPLPEAARGRFAKAANPAQDVISDGSDAGSDAASDAGGASDSEEETWAANSYHATRRAPGEPDSEDDEALGMEADEARRLQKRAKGAMAGADFGLAQDGEDDDAGLEEVRETQRKRGRLEDDQAVAAESIEMGDEEAIAFLLRKNPETLALLDDFTATAERMTGVERNLVEVRAAGKDGKDHPALAIMELEHQALSTYLPTLAFYFSLLLTPAPSTDLVSKVLERLSTLRSALATMEELDLTSGQLEDSESEDESDDGEEGESMLASDVWDLGSDGSEGSEGVEGMFDDEALEGESGSEGDSDGSGLDADESSMLGGLDDDELEMIMDGMDENATADDLMLAVDAYRREKLGLAAGSEDDESEDDAPASAGSKRKAAPAKTPRSKKAKLSAPSIPNLAPLSRKTSRAAPVAVESDYADATSLSRTDEADKASKRHTLRFHVSQVSQKAAKRESGGKNRVGGDDDLPRRSKERSRREVLKRQEHGGSKGEALDGQDWDDEDHKIASGVTTGGDDGEDYYDLVKKDKDGGKLAKQEKYDAQRMADKNALDQEGDASAAGPRGVTRKILANKGLQPKRAKINRNSRVKKRVQYDKAVKKVATMKSVYKGGQATLGHGEYQGEKSGIGSKVVKSVRLGGK